MEVIDTHKYQPLILIQLSSRNDVTPTPQTTTLLANHRGKPQLQPHPLPNTLLTHGQANVEAHVVDGSQVLLVIDIEHTVGEDFDSSALGKGVSQLSSGLQAHDKGGGVSHDGVICHHIGS